MSEAPRGSFLPRSRSVPCPRALRRLLRRGSPQVPQRPGEGCISCPAGVAALSAVGTAVPESPESGRAHTAGAQAPRCRPVAVSLWRQVVLATRAPPRRFLAHPAREPQVAGFTTTSTYQEAREPEEWKAMLADLISARLVVK